MSFHAVLKMISVSLIASSLYAVAPNAAAPLRIHSGTVVMKSKQHATILLVRNGDGDGPAEHLFQVWSNPGLDLSGVYRAVDVEYSGASLVVIVPATKTATTFTVKGYAAPATPVPDGFATTSFEVFGLNHQSGAGIEGYVLHISGSPGRVKPLTDCIDCELYPFEDPWAATGGVSCTSGGPYATSCSQSGPGASCSVTCSTGNGGYACCVAGSPPSCTCKLY